jgi:hypothetical protein
MMETNQFSETLRFLVFRISDNGQSQYGFLSSAMRLETHREGQYDLIDSSWVSVPSYILRFNFCSTDGTSSTYKCFYNIKIFKLYFSIGVHAFGLLHLFFISFSILVSGLYMYYQNCYWTFSSYLRLTNPDLMFIYSCSYTNIGYPVAEVSSF